MTQSDPVSLRWRAPLLWVVLVFGLSSVPGSQLSPEPIFPGADKVVHAALYGVGGYLVARAWGSLLGGFLIASGIGFLDEFYQSFIPGRAPDLADVLADALGAFLGSALYAALRTERHSSRQPARTAS